MNVRDSGLGAALSELVAGVQHEGREVSLDMESTDGFGTSVDHLVFLVCREALANVHRHANAHHVEVRVRRDGGSAVLDVLDDGRGFDQATAAAALARGHLGIAVMREHVERVGGSFRISARKEGGTHVPMDVPA
ncbi:MAG: sensor histidine kinase [Actinomycetota bacterium]